MKIHEYQAKAVLSKYGVPVPRGEVAFTPEEVHDVAKRLGPITVVKAQIHAGGRGKAGGVKLAKSGQEAENIARELLGRPANRDVVHGADEGAVRRRIGVARRGPPRGR